MEKINKHKKPSSYIYKLFIYVAGIPRCEHGNVFLKFCDRYCNSIDPPVTSCTSGILCTVKI